MLCMFSVYTCMCAWGGAGVAISICASCFACVERSVINLHW